jgi:(p)ppGpp synthase/HD superfamily hydrolase
MGKTKKLLQQPKVAQGDVPHWVIKPFNMRNRYIRLQLQKGYRLMYRAHDHELRQDGRKYSTHPEEVTQIILYEWLVSDLRTALGALLHDTREIKHPRILITRELLSREFGADVEADNFALTRKAYDKTKKETLPLFIQRIVRRGWRMVLVKLADRLHNLRTLGVCSIEKQHRVYHETMQHYLPLILTLEHLLPTNLKPVAARVRGSFDETLARVHKRIHHIP